MATIQYTSHAWVHGNMVHCTYHKRQEDWFTSLIFLHLSKSESMNDCWGW